jgi:hypothetical protein
VGEPPSARSIGTAWCESVFNGSIPEYGVRPEEAAAATRRARRGPGVARHDALHGLLIAPRPGRRMILDPARRRDGEAETEQRTAEAAHRDPWCGEEAYTWSGSRSPARTTRRTPGAPRSLGQLAELGEQLRVLPAGAGPSAWSSARCPSVDQDVGPVGEAPSIRCRNAGSPRA